MFLNSLQQLSLSVLVADDANRLQPVFVVFFHWNFIFLLIAQIHFFHSFRLDRTIKVKLILKFETDLNRNTLQIIIRSMKTVDLGIRHTEVQSRQNHGYHVTYALLVSPTDTNSCFVFVFSS